MSVGINLEFPLYTAAKVGVRAAFQIWRVKPGCIWLSVHGEPLFVFSNERQLSIYLEKLRKHGDVQHLNHCSSADEIRSGSAPKPLHFPKGE